MKRTRDRLDRALDRYRWIDRQIQNHFNSIKVLSDVQIEYYYRQLDVAGKELDLASISGDYKPNEKYDTREEKDEA